MRSSLASLEPARPDAKYSVRTRCPQCGRKHITVFRLRHVSTASSCSWAAFSLREALRLPALCWCKNSGRHPEWRASKLFAIGP